MSLGRGAAVPLLPEMVHIYPLPLQADEFARLAFEQQNLDVAVEIYDAQRRRLLKVDSLTAGRERPELVPFVAPTSGAYTVEVSGCATCGSGLYRARLEARRPATPTDRKWADSAVAYFVGRELEKKNSKSKEAEGKYQEALNLWAELGYTQGTADALVRMAMIAYARYDWPRGLARFQRVLPIYQKSGNRRQEAAVLYQVGLGYYRISDFGPAYSSYENALRVSRDVKRVEVTCDALTGLGMIDRIRGEFGKALAHLEEADALSRRTNNSESRVAMLNALGLLYFSMGEASMALRYHREAQRIAESSALKDRIAQTLVHLGDVFRGTGEQEKAVAMYLDALHRFRDVGDLPNVGITLNNLGLAYYGMTRYEQALESYHSALKLFKQTGNRKSEADALANIGWINVALNHPNQAAGFFEESLALASRLNQPAIMAAASFGLAWTERQRNNPILARRHAERARDLIETLRTKTDRRHLRMAILAGGSDIYEFLVDLLMEQNRVGRGGDHDVQAFNISERGRARSLLDSVDSGSVSPLTVAEVRKNVLDKDTVLLAYSLGRDRSYLWVLTPGLLTSHELAPGPRIEAVARKVQELLPISHWREEKKQALEKAKELSRLLLAPVANRLGNKRLLVVLPPSLQGIPFGALPDLSNSTKAAGLFWPAPLVARHEIVMAPSASSLWALHKLDDKRPPAPHLLAILADPVSSWKDERLPAGLESGGEPAAERFPRLKHTRPEALRIQGMAGERGVLLRQGFEANLGFVKRGGLRSYRILHFAMHGLLNKEDPEESALVLSQFDASGQRQDGYLRARDVAALRLQAELAVLSACQTGSGREIPGEGMVGLTQAFFTAGVPRVVVSLWPVDDRASLELMQRFYRHLLIDKLSAAAALRKAQVSMWQEGGYNSPSDWAPFVFQGDWH